MNQPTTSYDKVPPTNSGSKKRVVVAMSGGVDSSVAAALLVAQGHEVIGVMMRLWSEPDNGLNIKHNRCCTPDQMADARRVANQLQIPFYVLDAQDYFFSNVVKPFIDDHTNGQTPNPCINCNRRVRFTFLLEQAIAFGADFLATGHYARVKSSGKSYQLLIARDFKKDQSYVLHVLGQKELAYVLFPIGDYTKNEVRELAVQFNLPVASKSESMDLCFLADGDYRRFLSKNAPESNHPGPIISASGDLIGKHRGLMNYTIGQRKGLGISLGKPVYVVQKDSQNNALIVGSKEQACQPKLIARDVNWISGLPPNKPIQVHAKIRYRAKSVPGTIFPLENGRVAVEFEEPVFGITAGQGVVFYLGDVCIGGGIITGEESI